MEVETGAMYLQVKELRGLLEAKRSWEEARMNSPLELSKKA